MVRRLVLAIGILLVVQQSNLAPAEADIYTWTDDEGVIHFTNVKPKRGKGWKKVLIENPDAGSKAAAERGTCARCDAVPARDRSPERFSRYDPHIFEAAELYRIPVPLIRAVIRVESDYDPQVVSRVGARGLMQLMPAVEKDMRVGNVFDPRENILGGTRLLRILANRYEGDLVLTIAAYHAGPGSLAKYGNQVPPYVNTRKYLKMVLDRYYEYKAKEERAR
ncbi:MAG TPA: lytic transglycosylase domain-containing protein [Kofleriaceae bacterium]|nr:lytic transglycosylase domain-containing protein [Kofleriaceae bacterium]